jgi:LysM repeat protein
LLALLVVPLTLWTVSAEPSAQSCGPNTRHTVQAGQNLFRIGLAYGTTYQAIAAANGISNPNDIDVGQVLVIPCAGGSSSGGSSSGGSSSLPPGVLPPVYATPGVSLPPIILNCETLFATSPRDGMPFGPTTFYWNGVTGATSYRVNVYNEDLRRGTLVATFYTLGPVTHVTGDMGYPAGVGFRFSWDVAALVSDIPVCVSPRVFSRREAAP